MSTRLRPPTASAAHRVRRGEEGCDYPRRYDIQAPPPERPDSDREAGRAAHAEIELALRSRTSTTARGEAALVWAWRYEGERSVEAAFAWSPDRCEAIGTGRGSYAIAPWARVLGTVDLAIVQPTHAVVVDWKTGPLLDSAAEAGPQLRALGSLVLSAHPDLESCDLYALHLSEDGTATEFYHGTLDQTDAWAELDALGSPGEDVAPRPGPWCRYCPWEGACPAHLAALAVCLPPEALLPSGRVSVAATSNAHAVRLLQVGRWAEDAIEIAKSAGKAWIEGRGGSIVVDGREWRSVQVTTRSTPIGSAIDLARRKGATPEEISALAVEGGHVRIIPRKVAAPRGKRLPNKEG